METRGRRVMEGNERDPLMKVVGPRDREIGKEWGDSDEQGSGEAIAESFAIASLEDDVARMVGLKIFVEDELGILGRATDASRTWNELDIIIW